MFSLLVEPKKIKFSQLKIDQRYKGHVTDNIINRIIRISKKDRIIIKSYMDYQDKDKTMTFSQRKLIHDHDVFIIEE